MSAFAEKAGHEFIFFDTANYTADKNKESYGGYKSRNSRISLEFKHIKNKSVMPSKRPINTLLQDLESKISGQKIDVIGFSSFSDDWPFALFLIRNVRAIFPDVPIIVGGIHATIVPEQVIKHSEVDMVCIGEGEMPLVELLDSIDNGDIDLGIKSLWIKHRGKIYRNSVGRLLQLNSDMPMPDWTLYSDINFYYPFEGKLFRRGSVSVGRGCPYFCNFCINDFYKRIYPKKDKYLRFKSLSCLIDEIAYLKDKYKLEFLRFWDEVFLAMPGEYLSEFADIYRKEIDLPFTIETTANTINDRNARILVEMGCRSVSIGVETSNEKLRMKILNKPIGNENYDRCFHILTDYKLRKVANFMFFLPHQKLDDMWNDVYACEKWKIDHPSARIFYPYLGTSLREYCMRNDMLDLAVLQKVEDEESVREIGDLNNSYITFLDTPLKIDPETKKKGKMLLDNFVLFQETESWAHPKLQALFARNDVQANDMLKKIECEIYKKRFGEKP